MDYEVLRGLTLEVLRNRFSQGDILQLVDAVNGVEALAVSRGFYQPVTSPSPGVQVSARMPEEDREKTRQVLWDFTLEGLIFPGASVDQPDVHFLKRTIYGRETLERGYPTPYDPDGFLRYLRGEVPTADPTILTYATESLQTFLRGNLLASTVMLGVASEKAILLLIDEYVNAIQDPARKSSIQGSFDARFSIIRKFQLLRAEFNGIRGQMRGRVPDDLDIQLDGVFNLIRNTRNDAGHPTGVAMDRRRAYANLQLFTPYCKTVYALISYFQQNPII